MRRTIMTGQRITYNKYCKEEFSIYAQVHEKINNSLKPRMSGTIALRPSVNKQEGYYFLRLHTGKGF